MRGILSKMRSPGRHLFNYLSKTAFKLYFVARLCVLAVQMPAGLLYVKVIEAEHLPNMDILSKTDAYVVLFVRGRRKRKTKIAWNSLHPR